MKRLTLLMLFALPLAAEDISCFKVHDMWANDLNHYGVEWTNACRFDLPAIYVAVEFWDGAKRLGAGVWSLYYPGRRHKFDAWSSPVDLPRSATIRVTTITRDATILERK